MIERKPHKFSLNSSETNGLKLPKEDVATWIGYLGWNFFLMYDMIREYDPELAKMIKEKCQSWKDGFQNE